MIPSGRFAASSPIEGEEGASHTPLAAERIWSVLNSVPDPEIPAISIVDLGIVRDVTFEDDTVVVAVTPTYSGCPATSLINMEIETALRAHGFDKLRIERRISPPWTTAWISAEGRAKLNAYGIAPPDRSAPVACPRCGSTETSEVSRFGSTPCKAAWRCNACLEPFDRFKCI